MQCWGWLGLLHKADVPVRNERHSQVSSRAILGWEPPGLQLHTVVKLHHLRRTKGFFSPCMKLGWESACIERSNALKFGTEFLLCVLSDTKSFTGSYTLLSAKPILLK